MERLNLTYLGKRTKTVERRIRSLIKRRKAFYLKTLSVEDNQTIETWYVDSGGWAYTTDPESNVYNTCIAHIANCLKFLNGSHPIWYDPERPVKRSYVRRNIKRGSIF